jgi:hypothetical protein
MPVAPFDAPLAGCISNLTCRVEKVKKFQASARFPAVRDPVFPLSIQSEE